MTARLGKQRHSSIQPTAVMSTRTLHHHTSRFILGSSVTTDSRELRGEIMIYVMDDDDEDTDHDDPRQMNISLRGHRGKLPSPR